MTEAAESFGVDLEKRLSDALGHEVMDADEARELTERIRDSAESVWDLLTEAKERRAFLALGYETFEAYCGEEFGMSRSYAYRLIRHGEFMRELGEASVSPIGDIPEGATRGLEVEDVPAVVEQIEEGADPKEAVEKTVANKRASSKPLVTSGPVYVKKLESVRASVFNKFPPSDFVPELSPEERGHILVFVREAKAYVHTLEQWLKA